MRTEPNHRKSDSLSMQIYAALLGDRPRIRKPNANDRPRISMRVRIETHVDHAGPSPFHTPTLREQLDRCIGYAARALDEARARLATSRPATAAATPAATVPPAPTLADANEAPKLKPIVLIGPAVLKKKPVVTPQAA